MGNLFLIIFEYLKINHCNNKKQQDPAETPVFWLKTKGRINVPAWRYNACDDARPTFFPHAYQTRCVYQGVYDR